jgi:hypothetical protein
MILIKNNKFNHSLSLSQKRLNLTNLLNLRFVGNESNSQQIQSTAVDPVSLEMEQRLNNIRSGRTETTTSENSGVQHDTTT